MFESSPSGASINDSSKNAKTTPTPSRHGAVDVASEAWGKEDYYWLAGLCLLVSIFYAQLWMPGLVLIKRDAFHTFLPLKYYMMERLKAGELPQWFPYEGLGRPLLGIPVTGLFHPFTALYWLFSIHDAYRLSTLLSCLIGAIGTFLLGRTLGTSRLGSFLSAVAFACSGYVASMTDNITYLYSICVLPLFLACLEKATMTDLGKWTAISALVWASVILNGDVQTGYYYGFITFLWIVWRCGDHRVWAAGRMLGIMVLTILIAGIQLAPAWTVFSSSTRADSDSFSEQSIRWSTHPLRLSTLALSPIGDSSEEIRIAREVFAGKDQAVEVPGFWAESLYVGLPVLGFALIGGWRSSNLKVFVALAAVCLLLATGKFGGLYEWLMRIVPFWSAFRYPEKFMGVVSLALAVLAGRGVDQWSRGRVGLHVWIGGTLLYLGVAALLLAESSVPWFMKEFDVPEDLARHVTQAAGQAALFGSAAFAGLAMITIWARHNSVKRQWVGVALVILVLLDLARANLSAVHTSNAEFWSFSPGLVGTIKEDAKAQGLDHFRIMSMTALRFQPSQQVLRMLTPHEVVAATRRQGLSAEHNAVYHIESVQGPLPGKSLLYEQISRNANLYTLARYNVAYLIGRPSRFEGSQYVSSFLATVSDYDLALVRNPVTASPRVYLSRRPELLTNSSARLSFLEREDFLNGEVDVIEGLIGSLPGPAQGGHVTLREYRPESIRVEVETPQPAVLILADAFEPGWSAMIEGVAELPIFRANGIVRAVVVPSGRFHVLFRYETPFLFLGAVLSAVGCGMCALLIMNRR
ncbi:MAG: YfhO family protein [Nitrospira sp.]|nr:YfhO family protein [Nitrospira sp.]